MNTLYKAFGSVVVADTASANNAVPSADASADASASADAEGQAAVPAREENQVIRIVPVFAAPAGLDKADTEQAIRKLAQEEQLDEEFVQEAIAKVCTQCDG